MNAKSEIRMSKSETNPNPKIQMFETPFTLAFVFGTF